MDQMTNNHADALTHAADAAYTTWREEIGIPRESLTTQGADVQARWCTIAAAARSAAATHEPLEASHNGPPTLPRFQEPPQNLREADLP